MRKALAEQKGLTAAEETSITAPREEGRQLRTETRRYANTRAARIPTNVTISDTFSWEAMSQEDVLEKPGTKGNRPDFALGTTQALIDKYSAARNKYKPDKINVLLIAESPPSSGGYFYSERTIGKDHLFRETMKALELWPINCPMKRDCDKRPMLERFRAIGFFLIDNCEIPVDKMSPRLRRISTQQGALTLPHRVRGLDPDRILIVKKTVFKPVTQALSDAGFGSRIMNIRSLPFPSHGNQTQFRAMIRRLVNKNRIRETE